jgi:hypothetical protein
MLNVEELIKKEMLNSSFNKTEKVNLAANQPSENPWTKYVLLMGIIGVALVSAYIITKPKLKASYGTEEK